MPARNANRVIEGVILVLIKISSFPYVQPPFGVPVCPRQNLGKDRAWDSFYTKQTKETKNFVMGSWGGRDRILHAPAKSRPFRQDRFRQDFPECLFLFVSFVCFCLKLFWEGVREFDEIYAQKY
jgi:hypothetical protein